jgi:hypothetical protein
MKLKMKDMKRNNLFCTVVAVCSLLIASCSQNDEIMEQQDVKKGSIRIMVADVGVQGDAETRAVTDAQYRTTFSDGDKIGIYAIKDGAVVADISNIRLVYNGASGWSLDADQSITSLEYTKDLAGATFYAYYPYQETLTGFEANQSSPFDGVISAWTIGDGNSIDLSGENYTKYDLMTGTSTPVKNKTGNDYTLSFSMTHVLGMVVINLPPAKIYHFTNSEFTDEQKKYTIPVINPTFAVQYGSKEAKAVIPYSDGDNYRILVKPEQCTVSGTFNDGVKTYSINDKTIAGGKYALYTVDKANQPTPIEHELSVGDYYCKDGSLIKLSSLQDNDKANVIGVVYYVGNPQLSALYPGSYNPEQDVLLRERPDCVHGLVYALKKANDGNAFGAWNSLLTNDIISSLQGYSGYVYTSYSTGATIAKERILGYNNAKLYEKYEINTGIELFANMRKVCAEYTPAAPVIATGWYLPSHGEFNILNEQKTLLDTALSAVEGESVWSGITEYGYASSSIRSTSAMFGYKTDLAQTLYINGNNKTLLRLSLAF